MKLKLTVNPTKLLNARIQAEILQNRAEKKAKITAGQLSLYEHGLKKEIPIEQLTRLALMYSVPLGELVHPREVAALQTVLSELRCEPNGNGSN